MTSAEVSENYELLQYIRPHLLNVDYSKWKFPIICVSFVFFLSTYEFIVRLLGMIPPYKDIPVARRRKLAKTLLKCGPHVCASPVVGFYCIWLIGKDPWFLIEGQTKTLEFYIPFMIGLQLFDIFQDCTENSPNLLYVLHHMLIAFLCFILPWTGKGYASAGCLMPVELPYPFLAMVRLMEEAGLKGRTTWKVGMYLLVHSFHFRAVFQYYLWVLLYRNWSLISEYFPSVVLVIIFAGMIFMTFAFTPYYTNYFTTRIYRYEEHINNDKGE